MRNLIARLDAEIERGRIDLPGGWYLVRDDDPSGRRRGDWFLSEPDGVWVAHFWDGKQAGEDDVRAFANALRARMPETSA